MPADVANTQRPQDILVMAMAMPQVKQFLPRGHAITLAQAEECIARRPGKLLFDYRALRATCRRLLNESTRAKLEARARADTEEICCLAIPLSTATSKAFPDVTYYTVSDVPEANGCPHSSPAQQTQASPLLRARVEEDAIGGST